MEHNFVWIPRPLGDDNSASRSDDSPCDASKENSSLVFGGLDFSLLCSDEYTSPLEFGFHEVIQVVVDHLVSGCFDVFCMQGISPAALEAIKRITQDAGLNFESTFFADNEDEPTWLHHVILYKNSLVELVDRAIISVENDPLYTQIIENENFFKQEGMITEQPVDSFGLVAVFKMKELDMHVKVLSINLTPLKHEEVKNDQAELFRNLSLKKALYTLNCEGTFPEGKCCYFVYGSLFVTEGRLLNSPIHKMLTEETLRMVLPNDSIGSIEAPNFSTINLEKLYHYDPEGLIPVSITGTTGFVYHTKEAVVQFLYKKDIIDMESCSDFRKYNDLPCGGRFLVRDNGVRSTGEDESSSDSSAAPCR